MGDAVSVGVGEGVGVAVGVGVGVGVAVGVAVAVGAGVAVGAAVKVQGDDWLGLGEVCYCRKERLNFVAGLQLEHSLMGLRELEELNRKFMSELEPVEDLVALDVA